MPSCFTAPNRMSNLSAAGEGLLGYARRILSLNEEAVGRVREQNIEGRVRSA